MDEGSQINWTGKSGTTYRYEIYSIDWEPASDQNGNFIFARNAGRVAEAVYIGHGDLKTQKAALMTAGCVTSRGVDEFHCRLNDDEVACRAEADDLLAGNPEAYASAGCNEKPGD